MNAWQRRRPVERDEAGRYVLLLAVSFALSVIAVRAFLELTGYPQLGSSTLHIAHLLWGGLALTVALVLALVFANRWVMLSSAVLGGVGVGLFIDEVGKFITQDNNYFFPWAAPIIYAVFLVILLVGLLVSRTRSRSARADLYHTLEALNELLDHDLEASERARMEEALVRVLESDDPVYRQVAEALLGVVRHPELHPFEDRVTLGVRLREGWLRLENRFLTRTAHRTLLIALLGLLTVSAVLDLVAMQALMNHPQQVVTVAAGAGVDVVQLEGASLSSLGILRVLLVTALGAITGAGAVLIALGREHIGTTLSLVALLAHLSVVTLLTFYVSQFAAVASALGLMVLLLVLIRYRTRFLKDDMNALAVAPDEPIGGFE